MDMFKGVDSDGGQADADGVVSCYYCLFFLVECVHPFVLPPPPAHSLFVGHAVLLGFLRCPRLLCGDVFCGTERLSL